MVAPIYRSLIAGLVVTTASVAAAQTVGDSDSTVWRWHVTNALRAQYDTPDQPRIHLIKRAGPFLADGATAPTGDRGRH